MSKKIEYKRGENLGLNGIVYLHDTGFQVFPGGESKRKAKFICPRCGSEFDSIINNVKRNITTSCGCYHKEMMSSTFTKHGLGDHPLYSTWIKMKDRCYNKNNKKYMDYGGRGIIVCAEWRGDFKPFYDYVTKLPHYGSPGRTLDRYPNNDGDYEPGNVRWGTWHEQATNRRNNPSNTSGYIGVYFNKKLNKWSSVITVRRTSYYLGLYNTKEEAVMVRNEYITDNGLTEYEIQEIK